MKKSFIALAVATAFTMPAGAATVINANQTINNSLTGDYSVTEDAIVTSTAGSSITANASTTKTTIDISGNKKFKLKSQSNNVVYATHSSTVEFSLGKSSSLELESTASGYTLSGMLRGNVSVSGDEGSTFILRQSGDDAALAEGHEGGTVSIDVDNLKIYSAADIAVRRQSSKEDTVIKAKTIYAKGQFQVGGGANLSVSDFDSFIIDGGSKDTLRVADGNMTLSGNVGSSITLTNSGSRSLLTTYKDSTGMINISAGEVQLNAAENATASAVTVNDASSQIKINADKLEINAPTAIDATAGLLTLGAQTEGAQQTLVVSGDVNIGEHANASLTFSGAGSSLTGEANIAGERNTLNISDRAQWNATGTSNVVSLRVDDGVINLDSTSSVTVTTLSGDNATINSAVSKTDNGLVAGSLTATNAEGVALSVNLTGVTSDDMTTAEAADLIGQISAADAEVTGNVKEGMYNGALTVDGSGNVTVATNTLMRDTLDLATGTTFSLNRILMNDVRKRMGDLRSTEGKSGAWARYDGGRLSGEGLDNDFNTIQVGVDTVPTDNGIRFGIAASYTNGDADYTRGSADMDAYGLAFYGTWMGDSGLFADVVARMAKADTDVTIDGNKKGSMDNVALSLSGEVGYRYDVTKTFFVEPQAELAYTYVDADTLKLSDGSSYEYDAADSLIARIGAVVGLSCPNNMGNVYARVSAVHEFLGDTAVTGANGTKLTNDGKDTWVEFGVGAQYNINPATYVWADVERTEGAALDEDWRATVGVRYAF